MNNVHVHRSHFKANPNPNPKLHHFFFHLTLSVLYLCNYCACAIHSVTSTPINIHYLHLRPVIQCILRIQDSGFHLLSSYNIK
ncbi:hypothetical protein JHK82_052327 [Glycine max]|uniref:Uncharacterized protein n=2 Tax=Glycine subgen. Soja TaxID=1462606 RepID=K7MW92_SOYBN|nr:hypothetical protein JHK86_052157 [Glycine max]KAG4914681.1 hypothetical protein JHK87_052238 [Glycine soja]KAG4926528.1 hypothetical protein JHK85_053014 [Glycine max]KAG5082165.1 hypothetical protein JHK84_052203 [Glycine max]KAG5084930.1 hypothetical protein JHK82_052327 [Glycine max]